MTRPRLAVRTAPLTGTPVKLKEDYEVLAVKAMYTHDVVLPEMLHVAILRSPYAHALVKNVDLSRARAHPGVVFAISGAEIPAHVRPAPPFPFQSREPFRAGNPTIKFPLEQYVLATDRVRFVGEAVAAVVAEDRYTAEDALELIDVEYEPLPPVLDPEAALAPDSALLFPEWGDNMHLRFHVWNGDVEAAFADADLVVRERIRNNRFTGTPMETRAVVAQYDASNERLNMWDSSQIPHLISHLVHEMLGRPELTVHVVAPRVGGGYGQKWGFYPEEGLVALLGLLVGRPVKWVETRSEHMMCTSHARDQIHDIEVGVKRDGTIVGVRDRIVADLGVPQPVGGLAANLTTTMYCMGSYKVQNYDCTLLGVVTNKTPFGAHRGFGKAEAAFVIERMVDIIADRLGMDPAEVRYKNFIQPEEFPYICATGTRLDSGNYPEALRKALEILDYDYWRREQARLRQEGRYLGVGMALVIEPSSSTRMGSYNAGYFTAVMRITPIGRVQVFTGGNDEGQGHRTTIAQLTADELGVEFDDVDALEGDSELCPYGSGSYSSRFSVVGTSAVILAARQLREKVLKIAAHLLEVPVEELEWGGGRVYPRGRFEAGLTFQQIAAPAHFAIYRLPPGVEPGLEATVHYRDPNIAFPMDEKGRVMMFSAIPYDANACAVEVDVETGRIKILKYVSVHDCGNMVNPKIVEGQHTGALVHGLGGALYEEILYDDQGQPLAASFKDYFLPTVQEVPEFIMDHLVSPNPFTPGGFKGTGETGTVGPPPTLANAVEDALRPLGVQIRRLPLTPGFIKEAIAEARARVR